jgi:acetyl/propionyl-CoA carboxylase alpha subunit
LQAEADRIGYPVLIKASAGGGGKGMRAVDKAEDFLAALASCQREAKNSFGDEAVLIEKYVQRPRHIEIQVFGDTQGNYVYLFERDCSVQRRHQKVLEEAPAPGMSPEMRAQMGLAAVAAARAVKYVGAGTVEFIVEQREDGSMNFFFMEMNTRLQVEHPVTEAITGQDLVEWQLRVAAGEPLPLAQDQLRIHGHAIEARICAENPDNNFLPATGTLQVYRVPESVEFLPPFVGGENAARGGQDVRVDSGVREGDVISPFYDSMVAKLIVHGDTREQALARMDAALAATRIVGLATNVQFLRHVVGSRSFSQADLDTALIPREAEGAVPAGDRWGADFAVAATVAHDAAGRTAAGDSADPFSRRDGWRSHLAPPCAYSDFEVQDEVRRLRELRSPATMARCILHRRWKPEGRCCSFALGRMPASNSGMRGPAPDACMTCTAQGEHRTCVRDAMVPRGSWPLTPCSITRARQPWRRRASDGADAGQGAFICREGRRQGAQGTGAGRDGSDEDGAHDRCAGRWHGGRTAVCARGPGDRRSGTPEARRRLSAPARCRMAGGMPTAGRDARIQA